MKLPKRKCHVFSSVFAFIPLFCVSYPSQNNDFCVRPTGKHVLQVFFRASRFTKNVQFFEWNGYFWNKLASFSFFFPSCCFSLSFRIRFHVNFHLLHTMCCWRATFRGSSSSIFPLFPASVRFNWQTFKLNDAHFSIHLPQFASYKLLTRQRPKNRRLTNKTTAKATAERTPKKKNAQKKYILSYDDFYTLNMHTNPIGNGRQQHSLLC